MQMPEEKEGSSRYVVGNTLWQTGVGVGGMGWRRQGMYGTQVGGHQAEGRE